MKDCAGAKEEAGAEDKKLRRKIQHDTAPEPGTARIGLCGSGAACFPAFLQHVDMPGIIPDKLRGKSILKQAFSLLSGTVGDCDLGKPQLPELGSCFLKPGFACFHKVGASDYSVKRSAGSGGGCVQHIEDAGMGAA